MDYLTKDYSPEHDVTIVYRTKETKENENRNAGKEGKGDVKRVSFNDEQIVSFIEARGSKTPVLKRPEQRKPIIKLERPSRHTVHVQRNSIETGKIHIEKQKNFMRQQAGDFEYTGGHYLEQEAMDQGEGVRNRMADESEEGNEEATADNPDEDDAAEIDAPTDEGGDEEDPNDDDDDYEDEEEDDGAEDEEEEEFENEGDVTGEEPGGEPGDEPGDEPGEGGGDVERGDDSDHKFEDILKLVSRISVIVYGLLYLLSYVLLK